MEECLTVKELSEILKVSEIWVRRKLQEKKIPYYKINKNVRFKISEIEEWMSDQKIEMMR